MQKCLCKSQCCIPALSGKTLISLDPALPFSGIQVQGDALYSVSINADGTFVLSSFQSTIGVSTCPGVWSCKNGKFVGYVVKIQNFIDQAPTVFRAALEICPKTLQGKLNTVILNSSARPFCVSSADQNLILESFPTKEYQFQCMTNASNVVTSQFEFEPLLL